MNITSIKPGDIVRIDKKGRRFHGVVGEIKDREVRFHPIEHNISYRTAGAREVVGHWRKSRRKSGSTTGEEGLVDGDV